MPAAAGLTRGERLGNFRGPGRAETAAPRMKAQDVEGEAQAVRSGRTCIF